jgi:hypothetical protein
MKVTLYTRPNSAREIIDFTDIHPDDERYLKDNNVMVSLEELPPNFVALYGKFSDDPDNGEAMVLASLQKDGKTGMAKLVDAIKRMKAEA